MINQVYNYENWLSIGGQVIYFIVVYTQLNAQLGTKENS